MLPLLILTFVAVDAAVPTSHTCAFSGLGLFCFATKTLLCILFFDVLALLFDDGTLCLLLIGTPPPLADDFNEDGCLDGQQTLLSDIRKADNSTLKVMGRVPN